MVCVAPCSRSTPWMRRQEVPGALDLRSHLDQQVNEVGDFGLARAIVEPRFAIGHGGGHQNVFRAGNGDFLEDDMRAAQAPVRRGRALRRSRARS